MIGPPDSAGGTPPLPRAGPEAGTGRRRPPESGRACRRRACGAEASRWGYYVTAVRTWGEFDLLDEIGRGAFGTVYRAFHPALQQHVAIKLINVPGGRPRDIEKALEEPRRLASVRHEHVVIVHDARYLEGYVGICMELVRGESLAQTITHAGRLGGEEATGLGMTLCRALAAIHRAQLIHSDVKAQNVMREDGGRIVLMDFGAGRRILDPERTTGHHLVGTAAYMSPELFAFADPTPASDIYSLGVLLFHVLTGSYPVDGGSLQDYTRAHAHRHRRHLADLRDDLPVRLLTAVERALQPDPSDRYRSAGEMLIDLAERPASLQNISSPPAPVLSTGRGLARIERPGTADHTAPAPVAPWIRERLPTIAAIVAAVVLFVGMLGYAASKAYEVMFGLSGDFASTSPLLWLDVGIRTLPLPVFYMLSIVVGFVVVAFGWRLLTRMSATVHSRWEETSRRIQLTAERAGLHDSQTLGSAILLAQIGSIAVVYVTFHGLIRAATTALGDGPIDVHAGLGRSNEGEWLLYRAVTSALALGSALAWAAVLRRRLAGGAGLGAIVGGVALTLVFIAMFAVPWRIVHEATFQLARYGNARCFVIAERSPRVLLFCPELADSRRVIVQEADPNFHRLSQYQNIFDGVAPRGETGRSR